MKTPTRPHRRTTSESLWTGPKPPCFSEDPQVIPALRPGRESSLYTDAVHMLSSIAHCKVYICVCVCILIIKAHYRILENRNKQARYIHNWVTLLYIWNEHNFESQPYSSKIKKKKWSKQFPESPTAVIDKNFCWWTSNGAFIFFCT